MSGEENNNNNNNTVESVYGDFQRDPETSELRYTGMTKKKQFDFIELIGLFNGTSATRIVLIYNYGFFLKNNQLWYFIGDIS